ncbi:MAG: ABC transporter permease [Dehalococcoidia bacterium]
MSAAFARPSSNLERVIALGKRDLRVQLSYHFGQLMQLLAIAMPIVTFFYVSQLVGDDSALGDYQGGYFEFVLIGLVATTLSTLGARLFSTMVAREQSEGTLDALLRTPTPLWVLLAGSTLWPLGFAALEIGVYLGVGAGALGAGFSASGLLLALPVALLTVAVFAAIGIFSAAFIVVTKRGEPLGPLVNAATSLFAGALFPVALLPGALQVVGRMLPSYYAIEGLREALLGAGTFASVADEIAILGVMAAVLLPLSVWTLSQALRWGRISGTLASF